MPRKRTVSVSAPPQRCFVKELSDETPPCFQAMERLYRLASDLYGVRPWQFLDEDNLIVVRDSVSSELCYCSIMGALGEVLSMHAYIGAEGLLQFRRMEAEEIADPGEFFASTHCVYVEFVPRSDHWGWERQPACEEVVYRHRAVSDENDGRAARRREAGRRGSSGWNSPERQLDCNAARDPSDCGRYGSMPNLRLAA
jgi:hypothetical protein